MQNRVAPEARAARALSITCGNGNEASAATPAS
jgi:hypothetical protein